MTLDPDTPDPAAVVESFGLGGPVTAWDPVGGAWSNRVYRLAAGGHRYAVKEMRNPWDDPHWRDWLAESWDFEQNAIAAGVAAPRPVPSPEDGGCLAWVRRRDPDLPDAPVRVHHWADGKPANAGDPVGLETARWAGRTLATLHGLRIRPRDRDVFPVPSTDTADGWPRLAKEASRSGTAWAGQVASAEPAAARIAELATTAGFRPELEVMTHGDFGQKNIILAGQGSLLCDWDLAAPLVPRRELAQVAMALACWDDFTVSREVVRSYRQAGGDDTSFEPSDLGQPLMIGLDWIAFNVERAIGLRPATPDEATRARTLVPGLLAAISRQVDAALNIERVLKL